jgi:molybdenum cofactor guanylyltransferase
MHDTSAPDTGAVPLRHPDVTGCLLAGGEGRRMGNRDKGLVVYRGRPLAAWVLARLVPQTASQFVIANRNLSAYADLLRQAQAIQAEHVTAVQTDAPDLPPASGPVAGIITALRQTRTQWLMVVPCDTPHLPGDLVTRLLTEAERVGAEAAVPATVNDAGESHTHWVCVLLRRDALAKLETEFAQDQRKLRVCIQSLRWTSVSFADAIAFDNINSLETLNGRD